MTRLTDAIRDLRKRSGLSMAEMAKGMGYAGSSSYQRYEDPDEYPDDHLKLNIARRLIKAVAGKGSPPITEQEIYALTGHDQARPISNVGERANIAVGDVDVPVFRSVEGGRGTMIIKWDPIKHIARPDPLLRVKGGYGVYIVDDSMAPRFEPGDIAVVNPNIPVVPDRDAIFFRDEGDASSTAVVRRLLRSSSSEWRVLQWNPRKEFELLRAEWKTCHAVVGIYGR